MLKCVFHRLRVIWAERQMWWRYRQCPSKYEVTHQWFNIGRDIAPGAAYEQLMAFVRETVALSPRPYGQGAYGLVLAAIWRDDRGDRWETTFTYPERLEAYDRIASRIESWKAPPLAMMVGILPYGALALS